MILHLVLFFSVNSVISSLSINNENPSTTKNPIACGEHGDCLTVSTECSEPCGCDNLYYYNKTTEECSLNVKLLEVIVTEKYNSEEIPDFSDIFIESHWATKLRAEAERVFGGILISVLIFAACSALCALSACVYCAHVNYSDRKLRNDVKALSQKLNGDGKLPKKPEKKRTEAKAQSCNVVVEDAGVFVC